MGEDPVFCCMYLYSTSALAFAFSTSTSTSSFFVINSTPSSQLESLRSSMSCTKPRHSNVWNSSSRVIDAQWHDEQLEAHHARLHAIRDSGPASHTITSATDILCLVPGAQARATKTHQADVARDNRKLLEQLLALQQESLQQGEFGNIGALNGGGNDRPRPGSALHPRAAVYYVNHDGCGIGVPPAASHALYTTQAASQNTKTSMAEARRRREQHALDEENRKLVKRLLTTRSCVPHGVWQPEYAARSKLKVGRKLPKCLHWRSSSSPKSRSTARPRAMPASGRPPRWRPLSSSASAVACTCAAADWMIERLGSLGLADKENDEEEDDEMKEEGQDDEG